MQPITELDPRFSDPDATATEWGTVEAVLQAAELFWISTVHAAGRPHVTPLVAVWFEGAVYFCTGAEEQKAVNLRSNSEVVLTTGCNSWQDGIDVVVEGAAIRVTDEPKLRRLAEAWTMKWDGRWQFRVGDGAFRHEAGEALVFEVRPAKVLSFRKGTFAASRHRFTPATT
jgi:general stress protein 26